MTDSVKKPHILGRRIRFFRKRRGLTQLDVELLTGLAIGSISRIENGDVNPSKETVYEIAKILVLRDLELDYLIGRTAYPATEEEINKAISEVEETLNSSSKLTYLIDDRWRFIRISDRFLKVLKVSPSELNYVIHKTTVQTIVRSDSPVLKRINKKYYEELLVTYLPFYFSSMAHMDDDIFYQQSVSDIKKNPLAKKIWEGLSYNNLMAYAPQETRLINFNFLGLKIPLYYSMQPLNLSSRFVLVEYSTKNVVLDILKRLY